MNSGSRVIFDTGVLVNAALRPGSTPAMALHRALLHDTVCASIETLAELNAVLARDKLDNYLSREQRLEFAAQFATRVQIVVVGEVVHDCPDPKDNKFLALALGCGAVCLVASDPHLTGMNPWRGIPILPPAAFLVALP